MVAFIITAFADAFIETAIIMAGVANTSIAYCLVFAADEYSFTASTHSCDNFTTSSVIASRDIINCYSRNAYTNYQRD